MPSSKKHNIKCWVPINKCIIQNVNPNIKSAEISEKLINEHVPVNISEFFTDHQLNNIELTKTENQDFVYISRSDENSSTVYSVTTNIQIDNNTQDNNTQDEFYLNLYYYYFTGETCSIYKNSITSNPITNGNFTDTKIINFNDIKALSQTSCSELGLGFGFEISDSPAVSLRYKAVSKFTGYVKQMVASR